MVLCFTIMQDQALLAFLRHTAMWTTYKYEGFYDRMHNFTGAVINSNQEKVDNVH